MTTHIKILEMRDRVLQKWANSPYLGRIVPLDVKVQARRRCDPGGVQGMSEAHIQVSNLSVRDGQLNMRVYSGSKVREVFADVSIPLHKIDLARALAAEIDLLEKRE